MNKLSKKPVLRLWISACALLLAACGGGGGSPGQTSPVTQPATGSGGSGSGGGGVIATPTVTLVMTDSAGATINNLSGAQTGTLKAQVLSSTGAPVANAVVTFGASSTGLVTISPSSALTDANGRAGTTIKPASVEVAGALTLTAESVVATQTTVGSYNISLSSTPYSLGTLSFTPTPSGALPAFSTIQLNIPVNAGTQPATQADGLTVTSQCVSDGTAALVLGSFSNGVQTATYTNKGCVRGTDVLTATIGTSTKTISLGVAQAALGAINFIGANPTGMSIVLKGSGGLGRSESAQLTFQVVDQTNAGLGGVDVVFSATTTTGGLTVSPLYGTTDANGFVSTVVTSGTIPTPVRVIAEASRSGQTISGMSDGLTISTGLPIQKSLSLSAGIFNIEGDSYDNVTTPISVLLADQYGNPVSDGAVVNFVTEGGAIGSAAQGACTTKDGGCSVLIRSQNFRPVNGRVTIMAYAQGIENFTDSNGDGQYSCANPQISSGTVYRPLVDTCLSGGEPFVDMGDAFLDAGMLAPTSGVSNMGTLDGVYEAANGDLPFPYNHPSYSAAGDGKFGINYIRASAEVVFSGSTAYLYRQVCDPTSGCRDWTAADGDPGIIAGIAGPDCKSQVIYFRLTDRNNNPLPAETFVEAINGAKIIPQLPVPHLIPSTTQIGGTLHALGVAADYACQPGSFNVTTTTPKGVITGFTFKSN